MSLPVGGTSYQALNSSGTRARSKSPLDGLEGEDPLDAMPSSSAIPVNSSSSPGYNYQSTRGASQSHGNGKDPSAVRARQEAFLASRAAQPQNFTFRGVAVGLIIGTIICLSNTYFGLQTGWISGMAMPASLLGFAWFRAFSKFLTMPFTPVENVLVQCVAGAVGTMPLGVGLVGVIPALERLTTREGEGGPMNISLFRLVVWSVGVCFFGVFVAVPLRREMLVREKLKFPSGTATGLMISVLHADSEALEQKKLTDEGLNATPSIDPRDDDAPDSSTSELSDPRNDWKRNVRDLLVAFGGSGIYTLFSYFVPHVRELPIFGLHLSKVWEWKLNPSPAYVGQGIIMGPATTIHMLFGALLGWAILSPIAKDKGWAPKKVGDWDGGSKGWIVWVSLAIMLADSLVNLGWLILRPVMLHGPEWYARLRAQHKEGRLRPSAFWTDVSRGAYQPIIGSGSGSAPASASARHRMSKLEDEPEADAPAEHLPSQRASLLGLGVSVVLCIAGTHIAFPGMIPFYATVLAVAFSLILSVAGVRALGETDLNPVSGISKVTQLVFAAILPMTPASIPANLIAGAISESAALQAGDMMQDLKTGHLLGASPLAQFYGQILGSAAGAVIASLVYKLYTRVYTIPGDMFQMPTGFMWIMTARLVTGQGLPPQAGKAALLAGALWAVLTIVKIRAQGRWWQPLVPGGIAVAVGMYNTPSFTLARTAGGLLSLWWTRARRGREEPLVILASGLILGEGVVSIVNLVLASFEVPALKSGW